MYKPSDNSVDYVIILQTYIARAGGGDIIQLSSSTKLYRKISHHLYSYECAAQVTMPTATNEYYLSVQLGTMARMILSYQPLISLTQCTWFVVPDMHCHATCSKTTGFLYIRARQMYDKVSITLVGNSASHMIMLSQQSQILTNQSLHGVSASSLASEQRLHDILLFYWFVQN